MFSESEYEYILSEYTIIHNEKMKIHKKISIILIIGLFAIVASLYALGFTAKEPANVSIPVYSGILMVVLLIYLMFSYGTGSSKAFYEFTVKKVIDKYNFHMELNLKYSTDKKTKFPHNNNSGIFSRYCRPNIRMYIKGRTVEDKEFELYELALISGNGKNQTTHMNGVYIVLGNNTKVIEQVRTNGRPHLKGTNYSRIETDTDYEYRVYLKEDMVERDLNENYKDLFSRVMRDSVKQKGYLSVIENETHFAIHPFKLNKYRKLTLENLNIVYDKIKWLIELVDELSIKEF